MNRIVKLIFLAFTIINTARAQDIITFKNGSELNAHILHLNPEDLIFIPENSSDTFYIIRNEISKLQYKSGITVFLSEDEKPAFINDPGNDSLYTIGEIDAISYYRGYKTAAIGTMVTSILFPLGLIPAIACSATAPDYSSLGFKDTKLMENSSYYNGYTHKAHEIKKKKVWGGFAAGSGLMIGLSIALSVIVSNIY